MLPFPHPLMLTGFADARAQKWRIRDLVDQGGGFLGASEVMFLKTPGDVAQPGAGVASGTAATVGSAAAAFDGIDTTDYAAAYAGDGSTFLEYDFAVPWDIKELYYRTRTTSVNADQAPRHLIVEKFTASGWVTAAHIVGIPFWAGTEARRFAVTPPVDDAGANAHRYWRLVPLTTFGDTSCVECEVELLDALGVNVAPNFDTWLGPVPYSMAAPATNGVKTGNADFINFTQSAGVFYAMGLDFFKKRDLRTVRLTARSTNMNQAIATGRLDYSDDGINWVTYMNFGVASPWTLFAGISVSAGKLNAAAATSICQQNVVVNGQTYNFSFDYTKSAGSKLRIETGAGVGFTSGVLGASGTVSGSFTAQGPEFRIGADSAVFSGTLDNVVVQIGSGANLVADGTFSVTPDPIPTANQTRTFP